MLFTLLLLTACAPSLPTEQCEQMCAEAAVLYGGCLEAWSLDWSAAGYEDEGAFLESCDTWAWEARLIHNEALRRGDSDDRDWLERTCVERGQAFAAVDATCETYTSVDWNAIGSEVRQ